MEDPRRKGNTVHLGKELDVIVAGDIHGNRTALAKVISHAAVDRVANRRLILQEIIHGPADQQTGHDRSVELLLRAVRLKIAQPERVIFLLGNHDIAQAVGIEITKEGRSARKSFNEGVKFCFGEDAPEILAAIGEFALSMPLAVRCPNGVLVTHSLPSPKRAALAGKDILDRACTDEDFRRGGAAYEWTWGRGQTEEQIDALAEQLGVEFFVLGHRHLTSGFDMLARRAVTVASDNHHGCVLHFNTDAPLTAGNVEAHLRPIVGLTAPS
jgi:hypothetical protein